MKPSILPFAFIALPSLLAQASNPVAALEAEKAAIKKATAATPRPQEILAKAKAAQGGSAWDKVTSIRSTGTLAGEGGAASCSVPCEFIGNHIFVQATLNGKGPFCFILDSGGHNLLTPSTAKALGVKRQGSFQDGGAGENTIEAGYAQVDRIQIGKAWMDHQPF